MEEKDKILEKATLGSKGLVDFFSQFGDDVHSQIFLEVLFEGLMNEEALFISGEKRQNGDETDHSSEG